MSQTRNQTTPSRTLRKRGDGDYVAIALAFAEDAIEDRKRQKHGKWVRLAAKRFVGDLKRATRKRSPYTFKAEYANKACKFIETLPHVEGTWTDDNLIDLEPSQIFFIVNLFGFRKENMARRFNTALYAVARKNAKSTLAAAILIYCYCVEKENGPQVLSAATTGDQARVVWGIAKRMIQRTPKLMDMFTLEVFANAIARYEVGGTFKPINAKASTLDGLNPSALCFDELHAHKNHDLFNVLRSAAGARQNPLFLYTTTEGYETPGPWPEVRNFAYNVLNETLEADHFLCVIFALDDEDDDFDESKWIKANPLLTVNPDLALKIREEAIEAKTMPGALGEFRIKRLNRRASAAQAWVNLMKWRKCGAAVNLDAMVGNRCWGSFDLAATTDMNAWSLIWLVGEIYHVHTRYWVPEEAVKQRTERKSVNYQAWVDAGFITMTPGDVSDYSIIERDILADIDRFAPTQVAYDPWNAAATANNMIAEGAPLVQFRQGAQSYNPAMQAFEVAYTSGKLAHGDNPVLTWNMANLVARRDVNRAMAPDKKRSTEKIDGAVTTLMAFGLAAAVVATPEPRIRFL